MCISFRNPPYYRLYLPLSSLLDPACQQPPHTKPGAPGEPPAPRSSLILPQGSPGGRARTPGGGTGAPRRPPPNPKTETRGPRTPLPRTLIVLSMSCSPDILPRGPAGDGHRVPGTTGYRRPGGEGLARPRAAPAELRSASSPAGRAGGRQRRREAAGGPSAAAQPRSRRPGARHRRHLGRAAPPGGAAPRRGSPRRQTRRKGTGRGLRSPLVAAWGFSGATEKREGEGKAVARGASGSAEGVRRAPGA